MKRSAIALANQQSAERLYVELCEKRGGRFSRLTGPEKETLSRALDRERVFQSAERGRARDREERQEAGYA